MNNHEDAQDSNSGSSTTPAIAVPPGYGRSAITAPQMNGEEGVDRTQPGPATDQHTNAAVQARTDFSSSVHEYIRENIQLADQKAIFFFTGATALLAFLYRSGTAKTWTKPLMEWNPIDLSGFLAMVGLAIGALLALSVVIPRTPGSRRGYIFWEAVAEYESARQYADDIAQVTASSLCQSVAEHCHELAKVCRRKYRLLRISIYICSVGLAASIVVFLFGSPPPIS